MQKEDILQGINDIENGEVTDYEDFMKQYRSEKNYGVENDIKSGITKASHENIELQLI